VGSEREQFERVEDMLRAWRPHEPVYCIYPHVYRETAEAFLRGFPGRVLYAVKANDDADVVRALHSGGVSHFDCASLSEVALVRGLCPQATPYFMVPVSPRGDVGRAQREYSVRHFMVDHPDRLDALAGEIEFDGCVVFARMAVSHASAMMDLSSKFGAPPADVPRLLSLIRERGAEPALAFNVGSLVTHPEAYRHAIGIAADILSSLPFRVRLIDIGGGFPRAYPGFPVPPLDDYFQSVTDGRLYINDGMYGIFWELRFKAHMRFAARAWRSAEPLGGELASFTLCGPTCDASDILPGEVELPADIRAGDYIQFGQIGAYGLSGRTRFNGLYSDRIVHITGPDQYPPS